MKSRQRRNFSAEMKSRIALKAIKPQKTIREIASHHGVHQSSHKLEEASSRRNGLGVRRPPVAARHERGSAEGGALPADLPVAGGIGLVEKKVRHFALDQRREWIREDPKLSIREQCRLTGVSHSGYYYEPEPETDENLELMRLLDEQSILSVLQSRGSASVVGKQTRASVYFVGKKAD